MRSEPQQRKSYSRRGGAAGMSAVQGKEHAQTWLKAAIKLLLLPRKAHAQSIESAAEGIAAPIMLSAPLTTDINKSTLLQGLCHCCRVDCSP
jgi:hypothetical protein